MFIYNLTPKRVAMRRIIPVSQARVRLTKKTSAAMIAREPAASANIREDGLELNIKFNTVSDSGDGVPLKKRTPTI